MKTTKTMRAFALSMLTVAAATLASCSNDDVAQNPAHDQNTAVQVTAKVMNGDIAFTRGADGLNDATSGFSLLYSANSSSQAKIYVDDGSYSYTGYNYNVTGATAITAPATPPYFPASVNTVNVYGWYPATDTNGLFTVQDNQQSDANYSLSDLMLAQPATCTRALSAGAWSVTPAALSFNHVMSKIKLVVNPDNDVTITGAVIKGVKKQTTVTLTGGGGSQVTALSAVTKDDGTSGDITLLSGGSITSASTAAQKTLCAVFPAQTHAAGAFLEITASSGGLSNTITYQLAAAKNFAQNQQYNINATIGVIRTNETVELTGWTADNTTGVNIEVGQITDPAAMDGTKMLKNPLYYVAQYNLATIKGANNLAGTAATETTFCTSHNIMGSNTSPALMFTQADALKTRSGQDGALSGFHLPDVQEQIAVVPSNSITASGPNIWGMTSANADSPGTMEEYACKIAGATVTSPINSIFLCVVNGNASESDPNYHRYYEHYAVRFINTQYASAWHYVWTGNGLLIESYMLQDIPTTLDEAKKVLAALPTTSAWSAARNYAPLTSGTPGNTTSLCYRYLPACGYKYTGTGAADNRIGLECHFWSSSVSGDSGFYWCISTNNGRFGEYLLRSTYGFSVRLFRDS